MGRKKRGRFQAPRPQQQAPTAQPWGYVELQDGVPIKARGAQQQQRRPFRERTLPLDGGFDVHISGVDAFEGDIVVKYEDDLIILATGAAAESIRAQRNPLATLVPERPALPEAAPRPQRREFAPARRSNRDTFVSSSTRPVDVDDEPEDEGDVNVVPMQENGMPRAPRDRTVAQRRNLVVTDDKGRPALAITPEKLANIK